MKFLIKDFFSKCDQIRRKLWIWSHLLKKSLMEKFIFYVVKASFIILLNIFGTPQPFIFIRMLRHVVSTSE